MAAMVDSRDYECVICHEIYKTPKILPCYHRACRDCVRSWLEKGRGGGCPLCRDPILPPTHPDHGDLDSVVDALPMDLVTESLVKGHTVVTGSDVCAVCPGNMAATSYCFNCDVKLCANCSMQHQKIPATRNHSLQDLNTLTPQDVSAHCRSSCQTHPDRSAEVYCSSHEELICLMCATTGHRSCAEVKVIGDVAKEKRRELGQLVQRWRTKEAALAEQIQSRKDICDQQRKHVKDVRDNLQTLLDKRCQELYDVIQKEEDGGSELEKTRAAVTSHTDTLDDVLKSNADDVMLQMMKALEPRSKEVESKCGRADNMKAVQDLELDSQRIDVIKSALSALGTPVIPPSTPTVTATPSTPTPPVTTSTMSTTLRPAVSATSTMTSGTSASSPTTPTSTPTVPKPTGAALAKWTPVIPPSIPTVTATPSTPTPPVTTSTMSTTPRPAVSATSTMTSGTSASSPTTPTSTPTGPKPTGAALARVLKVGDRGDPGPGTVTAVPSRRASSYVADPRGLVDVRWNSRGEGWCCMGHDNEYHLELL